MFTQPLAAIDSLVRASAAEPDEPMVPMTTTAEAPVRTRATGHGGADFVGRNLITRPLTEGLAMRSGDDRGGGPRPGVGTVAADLRDPDRAEAVLTDVDDVDAVGGRSPVLGYAASEDGPCEKWSCS
ncbi:hypothetical protein [Streptomyces venezuelae]|uniref:hypothetical protein n=1 Tax=Streptomyces venezuelae TaxID=54571 RepID=UPI00278BE121|nr:hypothetical protein [Streptomyces venezuelae]